MSTPATDSLPIVRRSGYNPVPEFPFTGPTSILRRLHEAPTIDVDEVTSRLGFAPPVPAESVLAREEYREPVAGDPDVELTELGLRAPRRLCKCGHPHGLHEELRRGDRCTRCRCQGFTPEPVLPAMAEEERRSERPWLGLAMCLVGFAGTVVGSVLTVSVLRWQGFLP